MSKYDIEAEAKDENALSDLLKVLEGEVVTVTITDNNGNQKEVEALVKDGKLKLLRELR
jgi:hypothetical protein